MIQLKRESSGLVLYSPQIPYVDTTDRSKNYFRLFDLPDRLYLGKNSFRIEGNSDNLVRGSKIFIDVVDINGQIIYHEILDTLDSDKTKTVVVHIYKDTPPGPATIYVGGRIWKIHGSDVTIPWSETKTDGNYKHIPNLLWKGIINVVISKKNNSEVILGKDPIVEYSERLVKYDNAVTSSRNTIYTGSSADKLFMTSRILPYQLSGNVSKFVTSTIISDNVIQAMPIVSGNVGESSPRVVMPDYGGVTSIRSTNSIFSGSMVGGMIYVNGISLASDVPNDAADPTVFSQVPEYSASIVNVVSSNIIEVDRPFLYEVEYYDTSGNLQKKAFTSISSHNNFTASYYSNRTSVSTGSAYESFVSVDIHDIEPLAGSVDSIQVSYKSMGSFGEGKDVGKYDITKQNIYTDPGLYEIVNDGMHEKQIGVFRNALDVNRYWSATLRDTTTHQITSGFVARDFRSTKIYSAFHLNISGGMHESNYVRVTNTGSYSCAVKKNTEYTLEFDSHNAKIASDWTYQVVDIYISGSLLYSNISKNNTEILPLKSHHLGTYVGSVNYKGGAIQKSEFSFVAKESANVVPIFAIRSGDWDFANIKITPRKDDGFSPNHIRLNIPLSEFKRKSELAISFKYFNSDGVRSNIDSNIYGVVFSGSSQISYSELSGIPSGILSSSTQIEYSEIPNVPSSSLPPGVISSSAQFKNITDPFTGSFGGSGAGLSGVISASYAVSASWAPSSGTLIDGATYNITSSWSLNSLTASYISTQYYATHTQATPAATWSFSHNLNYRYPVITVYNPLHEVVIPEKIYAPSTSQTYIYFPIPITGYASATVGSILPSSSGSVGSASYSTYAVTASHSLRSVSASMSETSSYSFYAVTSSYSNTSATSSYSHTASYAMNSTPLPSNLISSSAQFRTVTDPFTGSFSGSFTGNGAAIFGVISSSYSVSSSRAGYASNIQTIGANIQTEDTYITAGSKGYKHIGYECDIIKTRLVANVTGSIIINVKRLGTTIGNIYVSNDTGSIDYTLSGWTTHLQQNDLLEFYVSSSSTYITNATVFIDLKS